MSQAQLTMLVLGGYGVFGGRLARLLSDCSGLEIIIAGRDLRRAQAFCQHYRGSAQVRPLALDRAAIKTGLAEQRPHLVVDASGPFQNYGSDPYGVIEACIAAGINYLDFADSADFVFGVSRFDPEALNANIFVLSGVSSFPVLTAAVLRQMAKTMDIVRVEGGIAPSPYAGIGLNVMRAVVGYAGTPVKLRRGGKAGHGIGLAESMRYTIAPPGRLPLRNIRFSLVDVPDLQVIPPQHPKMTDIWMGAGPVPESLHRILNLLAQARAYFKLPSLVPLSRLFYWVLNQMRFGEHRGGMFIHAQGQIADKSVVQSWHLLAEQDDGPLIPSMAIEAIVRKQLVGDAPHAGARSGVGELELADYEMMFRSRAIFTGFRDELSSQSLYQNLLGSAFAALPAPVQQLHGSSKRRQWSGIAQVRRGSGLLANAVAASIGFPSAAVQVPVTVTFTPQGESEHWVRQFGDKRFSSVQRMGRGRDQHLLVERFGIVSVSVALVVDGDRLFFVPRRWTMLGIPMPSSLLPRGQTFETDRSGMFSFEVEIATPLTGVIVAYSGTMAPKDI